MSHGHGVLVNVSLTDSYFGGIYCGEECMSAVTTFHRATGGAYLENVVFEDIHHSGKDEQWPPILLRKMNEEDGSKNVTFNRVFTHGRSEDIINETPNGTVFTNIYD